MASGLSDYLYTDDSGRTACVVSADLSGFSERHKIVLPIPSDRPCSDVLGELTRRADLEGLIIAPGRGWTGHKHRKLARRAMALGRNAYFHWPHEAAVEVIDAERIRTHFRIGAVAMAWEAATGLLSLFPGATRLPLLRPISHLVELNTIIENARETGGRDRGPVPFRLGERPSRQRPLEGLGVYLRTDYWSKGGSGGSYGHTCYVAKELAAVTERFVCFVAHRYDLLDTLGVAQNVLPAPSRYAGERTLVDATPFYVERMRPTLQAPKPAYLYERLCLGNYAGARLAQDLRIPYLVEYNGSELSMRRSFEGSRYLYEDFFQKAEEAAFRQATLISVVSTHVKSDLVRRGIDPGKILVNPNGADPDVYAPMSPDSRRTLRSQFGWGDAQRVVGFTGTFGAWHGMDVLAQALPRVCAAAPEVRFLLIGDGNFKALVDRAIEDNGLRQQVVCVGRVSQSEGARLLGACDVFVSPHSRNMVDSPFFGSPTKLFEYMAMGGGIVASDLEQIGEVLQPALRPDGLAAAVTDQVAVLCKPGDVEEFVAGVLGLVRDPALSSALGANARRAALERFSWEQHVARLFDAIAHQRSVPAPSAPQAAPHPSPRRVPMETGDAYKDETQRQWDNDPVGSQYVKKASKHTLEWFLEVERHRYQDYAPWMPEAMEFARHGGKDLLEIGGGMGTDLAQFAKNGARVTDVDLSSGHLELAQESFRLRGLRGTFIHHDAEALPFAPGSFDVVYSNGVIHHTPNTHLMVDEIFRVLRPGGRAIVMVYAEDSLHFWRLLLALGLWQGMLADYSIGEIMSRTVELSTVSGARPLVKVYTKGRLRGMFGRFADVEIVQRQLTPPEVPRLLRFLPAPTWARVLGWNLVVKARKPA